MWKWPVTVFKKLVRADTERQVPAPTSQAKVSMINDITVESSSAEIKDKKSESLLGVFYYLASEKILGSCQEVDLTPSETADKLAVRGCEDRRNNQRQDCDLVKKKRKEKINVVTESEVGCSGTKRSLGQDELLKEG